MSAAVAQEVNNDWETRRADHMTSLNWLNGVFPLSANKWK